MRKIKVGSDFTGVGAFNYAQKHLEQSKGIKIETVFACDYDKFARRSYLAAHGTKEDMALLETDLIKTIDSVYYREFIGGSKKKPTEEEWEFVRKNEESAARLFSIYYPWSVYSRQIPKESLDAYVTTPPCQSFSISGKRLGKDDPRGVLFFNSHEFIRQNNPRYFSFENVKGLLSDDDGRTFQEWINMLGGKSVNSVPVIFPYESSVPYHIYWKVLNAKKHGVPQNRERVFIVGIRDDVDNNFSWPKEEPLSKKLKDILETEVNEKYFLSDKMMNFLLTNSESQKQAGNGFQFSPTDGSTIGKAVTCKSGSRMDDEFIKIPQKSTEGIKSDTTNEITIGTWRTHEDGQGFPPTKDNNCPTIPARQREDGSGQPVVCIPTPPEPKIMGYTRYGNGKVTKLSIKNQADTIQTSSRNGGNTDQFVCIPVLTPDRPEKRQNGRRFKNDGDPSFTLTAQDKHGIFDGYKIRRLTPLECFRLMAFPDSHVHKCMRGGVSDSQLYKQAGNSVVVKKYTLIYDKLNL